MDGNVVNLCLNPFVLQFFHKPSSAYPYFLKIKTKNIKVKVAITKTFLIRNGKFFNISKSIIILIHDIPSFLTKMT